MWNLGLDYRCATGHGVGYLGSVHEGPNILRGKSGVILEPNMITTVEPGIYLDGEYGIRLENEILSEKTFKNEYGQYLEFRTITFVPFDRDAIEVEYLDKFEIEWLNKYNEVIFETLKTFLDEKELNWLKKVTDKFRDAIEVEYLDKFEIEWLNKYNEVIFETLKTFLDEKELNWLKKVTDKF